MRARPAKAQHRTAIVGIGATKFSRDSGMSELQLAVQAIRRALDDAGLDIGSIDGIARFSADSVKESALVNALGLTGLQFFAEVGYGGMAAAGVIAAAHAAVAADQARCVVCFRSMNGRSGTRFGRGERMIRSGDSADVAFADGERTFGSALTGPFGLLSPSQLMGMWANRYAYQFGISTERLTRALGEIAVSQRENARRNDNAVLGSKTLTLSDYMASRMIASPLRLNDFCIEIDGAVAVIVGEMQMAKDVTRKPVEILAANQALKPHGDTPALYNVRLEQHAPESARRIFGMGGVDVGDVDVATFYDATSVMVPMQLEDFGFCGRGEAIDFILDGETRVGGTLPTNTHGGMLSEGYLHGMNNALEVVRQIRGEASNQIAEARIGLFSVGYGSVLMGAA